MWGLIRVDGDAGILTNFSSENGNDKPQSKKKNAPHVLAPHFPPQPSLHSFTSQLHHSSQQAHQESTPFFSARSVVSRIMSVTAADEVFEEILTSVKTCPVYDEEDLDSTHELHLIIPNAYLNAVLVVPGDEDGRVAFPVVEPTVREVEEWHSHPQQLQRYVYDKLFVAIRVMFRLYETMLPPRSENNSGTRVNLVCQLLDHDFIPSAPLRWMGEQEICKHVQHAQSSEDPRDFVYLESDEVLKECKGITPQVNATESWQKITWLSFISEWTKKALEKEGYELFVGPVSIYYGPVSHTMACKVRRKRAFNDADEQAIEKLYVKATLPRLGEVGKTVLIARECPDIAGEVIAYDLKLGLMIMRDVGLPATYYVSPKAVFGTVRKLQSLSEGQLKRLKDGGIPLRDKGWYLDNIEGLIKAASKTGIACDKRIIDALKYLTENIETVKRMIQDCHRWNLPHVLVHGDLHPGNYGRFVNVEGGGHHMLFDWDRAFIGPALEDVSGVLWEPEPRFEKQLIDMFDELDTPWKSLIPDEEWNTRFRRTTRAQAVLGWCELFQYYLHACCACARNNLTWKEVRSRFQSTVVQYTHVFKVEFVDDPKEVNT